MDYCNKGHWEGVELGEDDEENDYWDDCKDYQEDNARGLDTPHLRPPRWPMGDMEQQTESICPAGQGYSGIAGSLSGGGGAVED